MEYEESKLCIRGDEKQYARPGSSGLIKKEPHDRAMVYVQQDKTDRRKAA